MKHADVTLEDKYALEEGRVYMTGLQALVRLALDQRRRDKKAGLNTAGFISGYRGSPLGAFDLQLHAAQKFLDAESIVFQEGLNEDLAATAVWGSQMVGEAVTGRVPGSRVDGVFGVWYGKSPGVDRSGDAFRHANFAGSSRYGGVIAVAGDDPNCRSSTLPSQSEIAFANADIPVFNPSSIQDVLDYGLYAFALSRFSGLWTGMIAVADTMDASAVINIDPGRLEIELPQDFVLPPDGLHLRAHDAPQGKEERLRFYKRPAVKAFTRANRLDRVIVAPPAGVRARYGIMTTGQATRDVFEALDAIGLTPEAAGALGVAIYKVAMPFPLCEASALEFCEGLEKVLVVEHKRSLIETQLKELMYHAPADRRPAILGKTDAQEKPYLPWHGTIPIPTIAKALIDLAPEGPHVEKGRAYIARAEKAREAAAAAFKVTQRTPFYCSGCPHNTSTMRLPEGSRALAGIGCHYMATWTTPFTDYFSHMGGEGVAWIGQAPFTDESHVFVNLGDGTYSHSGSLAIRASVAAGVHSTYKILCNGAVAMTGGQAPEMAARSPPQIAAQVLAEGVTTAVIVADDVKRYRGVKLPHGVALRPREDLDAVQEELKATPGVTVLIYDQMCAAERRRKRKRGLMPQSTKRLYIHPEVCEGCGDCSVQSNCISVEPLETDLGRKRRINQSSCNQDYSCLKGFCPSFVTLEGAELRHPDVDFSFDAETLPTPAPAPIDEVWNVLLAGVGGGGVTTVSAILGMAAHIDGRASSTLDMTGLAQKGGAVFSHVRIARTPDRIRSARIPPASADVTVACDLVVATSPDALALVAPERTRAAVNDDVAPTPSFLLDRDAKVDPSRRLAMLSAGAQILGEAHAEQLAEHVLGDAIYANMIMAGFAWQKGLIPVSSRAVHRAIRLNGVKVKENEAAFDLGRLAAHDSARAKALLPPEPAPVEAQKLDQIVARREKLLTDYQDAAWAARYRALVDQVRAAESKAGGGEALSRAVARNLAKLMAYKDEYEVARLFAETAWRADLKELFNDGWRMKFNLAPPIFAKTDPRTGRPRKREFGGWMTTVFPLLSKLRGLRGKPWDPFGWTAERRAERALIADYEAAVRRLLAGLSGKTLPLAVEISSAADEIRGYGPVKAAAIKRAKAKEATAWAKWEREIGATAKN
jgi:indolepyruvate ferredoxin oxidoreductase